MISLEALMNQYLIADEPEPISKHTYYDEVLLETGGGEWFFISVSRIVLEPISLPDYSEFR